MIFFIAVIAFYAESDVYMDVRFWRLMSIPALAALNE